ncbi:Six-bladed beta-propeller, TolB-like [Sergentomyia squamirostris]
MKCDILGVLLVLFGPLFVHGFKGEVEEMYYWKKVIYENLPLDEDAYIGPYRYFTPTNNNVLGAGYHVSSGLMIVAMGRLRGGIPATLAAFCTSDYPKGTTLAIWGFPDYQKNSLKASFYEQSQNYYRKLETKTTNPDDTRKLSHIQRRPREDFNIISVYYPNVDDQCDRLYVLDTGLLHYGSSYENSVQNPALIVFDLQPNCCLTRKFPLIRRIEIPNNLWKNPIGFQYVTPDYQGKDCDDVILIPY